MTSNRLLSDEFFQDRVDGWLSLSGGRIGPIELPALHRPQRCRRPEAGAGPRTAPGPRHGADCEISFIFATGEHEIVALPETSPWADKYGAGHARGCLTWSMSTRPNPRHHPRREVDSSLGTVAAAGHGAGYLYPDARDGRVIADVVRLDKGHTEGLEPKVTEELIKLMVAAPGGKAQRQQLRCN